MHMLMRISLCISCLQLVFVVESVVCCDWELYNVVIKKKKNLYQLVCFDKGLLKSFNCS
jgi:hypothetical protein